MCCSAVAFVREAVNRPHAFAQGLQQRFAPAERRKRRALLICLFVGFREEPHVVLVSIDVFFHGYDELDVVIRLAFLHREEMKLSEFLRRLSLREGPFRHSSLSFLISNTNRGFPPWLNPKAFAGESL